LRDVATLLDNMTREELLDVWSLDFAQMWYRAWLAGGNKDLYNKKVTKFQTAFMRDDGGTALRRMVVQAKAAGEVLWEVPKGRRLNPREGDLGCAVRELREEAGVDKSEYRILPGVKRRVSYVSVGVRYNCIYYLALANPSLAAKQSLYPTALREMTLTHIAEIGETRWKDIEQVRLLDEDGRLERLLAPAFKLVKKYLRGKWASVPTERRSLPSDASASSAPDTSSGAVSPQKPGSEHKKLSAKNFPRGAHGAREVSAEPKANVPKTGARPLTRKQGPQWSGEREQGAPQSEQAHDNAPVLPPSARATNRHGGPQAEKLSELASEPQSGSPATKPWRTTERFRADALREALGEGKASQANFQGSSRLTPSGKLSGAYVGGRQTGQARQSPLLWDQRAGGPKAYPSEEVPWGHPASLSPESSPPMAARKPIAQNGSRWSSKKFPGGPKEASIPRPFGAQRVYTAGPTRGASEAAETPKRAKTYKPSTFSRENGTDGWRTIRGPQRKHQGAPRTEDTDG
jgi:8-oxo-dGTP pyrophosphatase MutT (NUDIX family)